MICQRHAGILMNTNQPAIHLHDICHDRKTNCHNCRLSNICLPISLHLDDVEKLNQIIQRGKPLQKGEYLYRANDVFDSVFAIRSGAVKALMISDKGEEQVTGFYLPGEVVGMDGIAEGRYTNSVIALETASVCEIPFHRMEELSVKVPSLQRHFFQLMSREIAQDQQIISLLGKSSAEERIAALLLSISTHHSRQQLSATAFRLPMSRTDIGNYLGLTIETVSRIFTRLQQQNIIDVDKKEIFIKDIAGLQTLANGGDTGQS